MTNDRMSCIQGFISKDNKQYCDTVTIIHAFITHNKLHIEQNVNKHEINYNSIDKLNSYSINES